ncbi:MAG TPA: 4-hydroxybenzoate 3-monooxygenase [Jiangellaceae bacterium]
MRTQVGIVGAGPAGLLLSHLLHQRGISSVVLEARSRDYIEHRVRAGVLEQGTVDTLREADLSKRLDVQGLRHEGIELRFDGAGHRVPMADLTGRAITVYGQQEIIKDLVAQRLADGGDVRFEVSDVGVDGIAGSNPTIGFRHDGRDETLECDFVAGCDGFHGVSRDSAPAGALHVLEREYPFAWLGILAEAPPAVDELIYCLHENGFALYSMRSPTISRLYLQVVVDEDIDKWPDDRIWDELTTRFALAGSDWKPTPGPIIDKGVTPMRSFVTEPMQVGRLFLAGDAAHIVPPTGAKGLNLAVNDVRLLAGALEAWYASGDDALLESYSRDALRRVWRVQHFSWWMTQMLHRFPDDDEYGHRVQVAQLRNVVESPAYAKALSENYVG